MSENRWVRFSLVALVLCVGCGSLDAEPAPSITAIYGAPEQSVLTPYPSDRYADADSTAPTGRRLAITNSETRDLIGSDPVTLAELDAQDGFSIHGGVVMSFSGRPDIDTIARIGSVPEVSFSDRVGPPREAAAFTQPDSPLLLVDVDPASQERGQARGLIVSYWEHDGATDGGDSEYTIIAQPAKPLRPRTRYLFVATDGWRGDQGELVAPSARTKQLLAGEVETVYGVQVAEGLAVVGDEFGVKPGQVVLATAFTTQSVHEELLAAASAQRNMETPKVLAPWLLETPVADDGRVRLRAVMEAPAYRAEDERFVIDDGVPRVMGKENLEVFLAAADDAQTTPRPVVIYGHGLSGDKDGCWGTAQRLADLGVAVFAIDAPHHGTRGGTTVNAVTSTTKFFGIDPDDRSFVIGRARDNFRQMALDQLTLVRLISSLSELDVLPVGAPDGKPDLDTSRILYIGHSFGAVQGATIFALAPEVKHAVWNVGGAGLMTLIRDSDLFTLVISALRPPEMTDPGLARFLAVAQGIIDPGDPLSFAAYGTGKNLVANGEPRDVLLQEVIADSIVPNTATRALARAANLQILAPVEEVNGLVSISGSAQGNLATGATGVMTQFEWMHGDEPAEHGELIFAAESREQYVEFFRSGLQEGRARVLASP